MAHDPDDAPSGVCTACGSRCQAVWRDLGIGNYEYWGTNGIDEDWRWVSPCCWWPIIAPPEEEER